jgi:hypothetical protein
VSRPGQTSKSKGPRARKAVPAVEQLQASQKSFSELFENTILPRAGGTR